MKRTLLVNFCLAVLLAVTGSVGCRKKPIGPTPIPSGTAPVGGTDDRFGLETGSGGAVPERDDATGRTIDDSGLSGLPLDIETDMLRDEAAFRDSTIYFDFDRSSVRASERSKIETVASHLQNNPTHKLKMEGHADERGTEGYNVSLGERRALAVREYLINLGIADDRVTTTSFGEMRPAQIGQNETAWAANRRAEFILLLPKP